MEEFDNLYKYGFPKRNSRAIPSIWYPGSARASREWIDYLKGNFSGDWYYTDIDELQWVNNDMIAEKPSEMLRQRRIKFQQLDTLSLDIQKIKFDIIVISNHPGLKTASEIIENQILQREKPEKFVFRTTNEEDFLTSIPIIESLNFKLYRIVEPANLQKYAEFVSIDR